MNSRLLNQLMELSEEEKDYRVGNFEKLEEMYRLGENMEIDSELFLSENRLITVRRHSRFAEFPLHGHNYIELMYVCHGEIVQIMDGKKIILREGDFMMLNQYMKHRILRADYEDIGVNFIALPEFFDLPLTMQRYRNAIADFMFGILKKKNAPQYLLFHLKENKMIENLMENIIASLLDGQETDPVITQYSMGLVFLYILGDAQNLMQDGELDFKELVAQATLKYIDEHFQDAALCELSKDFGLSDSALSKIIKAKLGFSFQELLIRKRFQKSAMLLTSTNLIIEDIAQKVGYANFSYFYRGFKNRYGCTPKEYRIRYQEKSRIRI